MFDINNFDDPEVWDLICDGDTKGVFQLESNLGKHWAKETKPRNIKELAALISLIRPGTLLARDANGKSMTQVYADRKAKKADSPVEYLHDSVEPILKETYGVLVYQEQSMMIAQKLAGFDLKEADALRKAIGKKKADLMEKVKKSFLEGAEEQAIVTKEIAEELFSWIEKSNRYAFNKSHAVSYAINAYWSAYCKCHRRKKFYEKYLNRAEKKPKPDIEKKQLIMDAKRAGIEVLPPRLQHLHNDFYRGSKNGIVYGLRHVKHVGKESEKIMEYMKKHDVSEYTWMDCLVHLVAGLRLNKRATIALISVGAFNGKNNLESRQKMLYEFDSWKQLSAREQQAIVDNYTSGDPAVYASSLSEAIENMFKTVKVNSRRKPTVDDIKGSLDNPFYDIEDKAGVIAMDEEKYMACSLTCNKVDGLDLNMVTNMCQDVSKGMITKKANLAVEIVRIKVVKTKKGKNPGQEMSFLTIEDGSGALEDVVVFPEAYDKYKDLLLENNTVLLMGEVDKKKSFIVNQVSQI
ncbi:MAG: helix-hairpin-helix domain-containing protein [Candidatus Kariarchaeaceae archaeon]|jgi:DNA polymerase-3 subunit alpha